MSGEFLQLIFLLLGGGKKKIETIEAVDGFAFSARLDGSLAGAHRLDRDNESRKHGRFGHGDVVRAQYKFQIWLERREPLHGIHISVEIGFRPEKPDGSGIIGV